MFISFVIGLFAGVILMAVIQIKRIKEYEEEIAIMESEYHRYAVRIANLENQLDIYEKGGKPEKNKFAKLLEKKSIYEELYLKNARKQAEEMYMKSISEHVPHLD